MVVGTAVTALWLARDPLWVFCVLADPEPQDVVLAPQAGFAALAVLAIMLGLLVAALMLLRASRTARVVLLVLLTIVTLAAIVDTAVFVNGAKSSGYRLRDLTWLGGWNATAALAVAVAHPVICAAIAPLFRTGYGTRNSALAVPLGHAALAADQKLAFVTTHSRSAFRFRRARAYWGSIRLEPHDGQDPRAVCGCASVAPGQPQRIRACV